LEFTYVRHVGLIGAPPQIFYDDDDDDDDDN